MKKKSFLTFFLGIQFLFIFMHIHKHMQFIKQSFSKQKNEKQYGELVQKKQTLMNTLYIEKSRVDIKQFAQENGLNNVPLSKVKRVS